MALALPYGLTPQRLRAAFEAADGDQRARLAALLEQWEAAQKQRQFWTYFPDEGPLRRDLYPKHMQFFEASAWATEILFLAGNRVGKCLPLDAPVRMADGTCKALRDVEVGDYVLGYDMASGRATPTRVTEVVRSGEMEVFESTFSDGGAVRCTRDHWMPGYLRSGRRNWSHGAITPLLPKKRRFWEYAQAVGNTVTCRPSFLSPTMVEFLPPAALPVPPYAMGALLGDGNLTNGQVRFASGDASLVERVAADLGDLVSAVRHDGGPNYRLIMARRGNHRELAKRLRDIGAWGKGSREKRVPARYLHASADDRRALLAGLVDTDGTAKEFTSVSAGLVEDFAFLVRSLGGKATVHATSKVCGNAVGGPKRVECWRCYWRLDDRLPLHYKRKQPVATKRACDYARRIVRDVRSLGMRHCGCITVEHPDHCFIAYDWVAVGNTESGGGYATVCHLTGRYPDWWPGRRFDGPIQAWCAGDTMETTRDIQQFKLLGPPHAWGTGVMPGEDIGEIRLRRGVENAVASVRVRHQSGGWSTLGFKSYDQGRRNFQGTERHVIWLDEECPLPVYEECITRTMATPRFEGGLVMLTFTPLKGLSPVVLHFLPSGRLEESA